MEELIEYIIKSLVGDPDAVVITKSEENPGFATYYITVASEDMGIIIGKEGRMIRAIRTLARMRGLKTGEKARIEIQDETPMLPTDPNEAGTDLTDEN